jgi:hypothetical protein
MLRRTLAPRIGYSEVVLAYEQNLLDVLMNLEWFDVFEYIMDEIWNIATLRDLVDLLLIFTV